MGNWLFWLVMAVLVFYVYLGYKRGLVSIIISMVVLLGSAMLTSVIAPRLNSYVLDSTPIYDAVQQGVYDGIKKNNVVGNAIEQVAQDGGAADMGQLGVSDLGTNFDTMVSDIMDKVNIPQSWKNKIMEANVGETASESILNTTNQIEDVISAFMSVRIATLVCSCGCYIVAFIVVYFVLSILSKILFTISDLPGISMVNKIGGMLVGLLQGTLIVWVFFVVITVLYSTELGQSVMTCINSNPLLKSMYDNNIIMKVLMGLSM